VAFCILRTGPKAGGAIRLSAAHIANDCQLRLLLLIADLFGTIEGTTRRSDSVQPHLKKRHPSMARSIELNRVIGKYLDRKHLNLPGVAEPLPPGRAGGTSRWVPCETPIFFLTGLRERLAAAAAPNREAGCDGCAIRLNRTSWQAMKA